MSADKITCPACGAEMPANALLCPECGRANISSAFAAPSTTQQAQQSTDTGIVESTFDAGSTASQSSAYAYSDTGIPKTVLPWETSTPEDTPDPVSPAAPDGNSDKERKELLQRAVNSIEELREAEIRDQDVLRQKAAHTIDDLRRLRAGDRQSPDVEVERSPVGSPQKHTQTQYPPQSPPGWAGSMVRNNASNAQQHTLRRVSYQPTQQEYYNISRYDQAQQRAAVRSGVNVKTAVNLEYLGFIGLLGIGHIYAGYIARGIALFIGWLVIAQLLIQSIARGQGWCFVIPALLVPGLSYRWLAWSLRQPARPSQ